MNVREKLSEERTGLSHSVTIGGKTKLYLQTGEYPDGRVGELFITIDKAGGQLRAYDVLATCISIGLQSGISIETYIKHLRGQRMEPSGVTDNPEIALVSSISDYIGRWLEKKYTSF